MTLNHKDLRSGIRFDSSVTTCNHRVLDCGGRVQESGTATPLSPATGSLGFTGRQASNL